MLAAVNEMQRDLKNIALQVNSLAVLGSAYETEKEVDSFQKAIECVNATLKVNQDNEEIVNAVINFHSHVLSQKKTQLIEAIPYHSSLTLLLGIVKSKSSQADKALHLISKAANITRLAHQFSNPNLVQLLVYISRVNIKSESITLRVCKIALKLDPRSQQEYKDLCNTFLTMIKNTSKVNAKQKYYVSAFAHVSNEKILIELGSTALPLITEIALQQGSFPIIKAVLQISTHCPDDMIDVLQLRCIEQYSRRIKSDRNALKDAIHVIATKIPPKDTFSSFAPLSITALEIFSQNKQIVEESLTVCFRALSASKEIVPVSSSLVTIIVTTMNIYPNDKGVIRRCASILHTLSADPSNDPQLLYAAVPLVLMQAMKTNIADSTTIRICSAALNNVVSDNKVLAMQLSNAECTNDLKNLVKTYREKPQQLKSLLLTMKHIVESEYNLNQFLDLPSEIRDRYTIKAEYLAPMLKKTSDDAEFVRAAIMLIMPSPKSAEAVSSILLKYINDPEVVLCGLKHNINDITVINRALMAANEDAFRMVSSTLKKTTETLPAQTIAFLLTLDDHDAVDVLLNQIENGAESLVNSQFQLTFISQVVIADKLCSLNLWKPSESDFPIIFSSLCYSKFDKERLKASIRLIKKLGVTSTAAPILFEIAASNASDKEIIKDIAIIVKCIQEPSNNFPTRKTVVSLAKALKTSDESSTRSILDLFVVISNSNDVSSMNDLLILQRIIQGGRKSDECAKLSCEILGNLMKNEDIAQLISHVDCLDIAFTDFGPEAYRFVQQIGKYRKFTDEQVDRILKEFNNSTNCSHSDALIIAELLAELLGRGVNHSESVSIKTVNLLISMYLSDSQLIKIISRILTFVPPADITEELIFSLMDALRSHSNEYDVVVEILCLYDSISDYIPMPESQSSIKIIVDLLEMYSDDSTVCTSLFPKLLHRPEAYEVALKALDKDKGEDDLKVIAQYLMSCGVKDYSNSLPYVFEVMNAHNSSFDICTQLAPIVFFASDNENTHFRILSNMDLLLKTTSKFINSNRLSRAFVAIVCRLSDNQDNVSTLEEIGTASVVSMVLKAWSSDAQVYQAVSGIIINFVGAGYHSCFTGVLPYLAIALEQEALIGAALEAISVMAPYSGEYAKVFADRLLVMFLQEDTEEDVKEMLMGHIILLANAEPIESVIFDHVDDIFGRIASLSDEQQVDILRVCSCIQDKKRVKEFGPHMKDIMDLLQGKRIKLSTAAGGLVLQIARLSTEMVDEYLNTVMSVAKMATGDQLKVCLAIRDQILGIKKN